MVSGQSSETSPHEHAVRTAIDAASEWARSTQGLAGRLCRHAVTGVRIAPIERLDVVVHVETRRVVQRTEPIARRTQKREPRCDVTAFDPWSPDVQQQIGGVSQVITCPACDDAQQVICVECRGSLQVSCGQCGGSGRTISERSGRIVNCRSCKGDGTRKCPCRDGFVDCPTCRGKGCVREWLALEQSASERRAHFPEEAFGGGAADDVAGDVELVTRWRGAPADLATSQFGTSFDSGLVQPYDTRTERVTHVAVDLLRSYSATVSFRLCGEQRDLQVHGWTGRVASPPVDTDTPFRRLRRRVLIAAGVSMTLGALLTGWYGGRDPFYAASMNASGLALLALAAPFFFVPVVITCSMPRGSVPVLVRVLAAVVATAAASTQTALALSGQPSLDLARDNLTAGRIDRALLETSALVARREQIDEAMALHDRAQLEKARRFVNAADLWRAAPRLRFYTDAARAGIDSVGLQLTGKAIDEALRVDDAGTARVVLSGIPKRLTGHEDATRLRATIRDHEIVRHWRTVENRSLTPLQRIAGCREIEAAWSADDEGPSTLPARRVVGAACQGLRREQAELQRRADAQATARRLAVEREARQREARERAAMRSWAMAPLLCRDGTLSPSCVCGGSRRGCCSHHGGVSGCSQ